MFTWARLQPLREWQIYSTWWMHVSEVKNINNNNIMNAAIAMYHLGRIGLSTAAEFRTKRKLSCKTIASSGGWLTADVVRVHEKVVLTTRRLVWRLVWQQMLDLKIHLGFRADNIFTVFWHEDHHVIRRLTDSRCYQTSCGCCYNHVYSTVKTNNIRRLSLKHLAFRADNSFSLNLLVRRPSRCRTVSWRMTSDITWLLSSHASPGVKTVMPTHAESATTDFRAHYFFCVCFGFFFCTILLHERPWRLQTSNWQ